MEDIKSEILGRFRIEYSVFKSPKLNEVHAYIAASRTAKKGSDLLSLPRSLVEQLGIEDTGIVLSVRTDTETVFERNMYLSVGGNYIMTADTNIHGRFCLSRDVSDIHDIGFFPVPEKLVLYINGCEIGDIPNKAITGIAKLKCEDQYCGSTYMKLRKYEKQLRFPRLVLGRNSLSGTMSVKDGKWNISISC